MKRNKVLAFYQNEINNLSLRLSKAEHTYALSIQASIRYFMAYGYFKDELKDREMNDYLKYVDLYCKLLALKEKYLHIKGVELCPAESR